MTPPAQTEDPTSVDRRPAPPAYEAPEIVRLGSLGELTRGGLTGPNDGFGGAGLIGSI